MLCAGYYGHKFLLKITIVGSKWMGNEQNYISYYTKNEGIIITLIYMLIISLNVIISIFFCVCLCLKYTAVSEMV